MQIMFVIFEVMLICKRKMGMFKSMYNDIKNVLSDLFEFSVSLRMVRINKKFCINFPDDSIVS